MHPHSHPAEKYCKCYRCATIKHLVYYSQVIHLLTIHALQKAGQDFLAGIGSNTGGGSRRMPELCCITIEVTAQNPIRGFRYQS
jgi:hypothetical protein